MKGVVSSARARKSYLIRSWSSLYGAFRSFEMSWSVLGVGSQRGKGGKKRGGEKKLLDV